MIPQCQGINLPWKLLSGCFVTTAGDSLAMHIYLSSVSESLCLLPEVLLKWKPGFSPPLQGQPCSRSLLLLGLLGFKACL